jgi:2,5-dihydroxypyridine 5,6-dioxygenase
MERSRGGKMSSRAFSSVIEQMLKLQKAEEGDKVIVLTSHVYDKYTLDAYMTALCNLNAQFMHIIAPPVAKSAPTIAGPSKGAAMLSAPSSRLLVDTLKSADLILHVYTQLGGRWGKMVSQWGIPHISIYSDECVETLMSGKRWLDIMVDEVNFRRLFPTPDLIRRTKAGAEIMQRAVTLRITSKAGTNLTLDKKGRKGHAQFGVADEQGRWDNYGFGLVACAPVEDTANGTLVLDTGDYILSMDRDVTEPVKCQIKDGKITEIEGGFTALLLRKWFESWKDPEAYGISHIGWGTNVESAVWTDSQFFCVSDAESYPGVMQIAFGSNYFDTPALLSGLGGKRRTAAHMDIDLLNHNFYLDGELICEEGKIVYPNCKNYRRHKYAGRLANK